jgi:dTDP-4-dehydrorhamnose reductase
MGFEIKHRLYMKKILLLGCTGQLGWELQRTLLPLGQVLALDAPVLDFTNVDLLRSQVLEYQPDLIVNAVAYTAVDLAESQPELAMKINAKAPELLAQLACQLNAGLIHYSTDFVFDGTKKIPYTELDGPNPLNAYGKTKLAGDEAILASDAAYFIFRTSWVYSNRRDNFVRKVLGWSRTKTELKVVNDQVGCPTSARFLAEASAQVIAMGKERLLDWMMDHRGVYNLAGGGYASRFEWAEEILRQDPQRKEQIIEKLVPARSDEFPTPAIRPAFSPLSCQQFENTFGLHVPDWKACLRLVIEDF